MMTAGLWGVLAAMALDAALGEPKWLWSRLPHPAVLMGRAIGFCDARVNTGSMRRLRGVLCVLVLALMAGVLGWGLAQIWWVEVIIAAILLAQRSLVDHVRAVAEGLTKGPDAARHAVSMIVGRDVATLPPAGIARAAIESAAENFSDGATAPLFWLILFGLPGLMVYKLVNTADSMIGYRTPRHAQFGWAAARLDDVLNWVPARLTAALILLSHGVLSGWHVVLRDAPLHRSPNAGWPEAAMAAVLNVALAGPRSYDGVLRDFPFVNAQGRHDIGAPDVLAATRVLWRAWGCVAAGVLIIAVLRMYGAPGHL